MTKPMPNALVISKSPFLGQLWAHALTAAGWRAFAERSIASVAAARTLGFDVVVFDAETMIELEQLAALATVVDLPPILIRASALACPAVLRGSWCAALHVGAIDPATLVRTAGILRLAGRDVPTALPVHVPPVRVTKWSARVY
jgi:hypothetical protein